MSGRKHKRSKESRGITYPLEQVHDAYEALRRPTANTTKQAALTALEPMTQQSTNIPNQTKDTEKPKNKTSQKVVVSTVTSTAFARFFTPASPTETHSAAPSTEANAHTPTESVWTFVGKPPSAQSNKSKSSEPPKKGGGIWSWLGF